MKRTDEHDFLWCVFVTAMEGGINYWCGVNSYRPGRDPDEGGRTSKQVCDYENFRAEVECCYDEVSPDGCYLVNAGVIKSGIKALRSGKAKVNSRILGWIVEGDNENDAGNIDADAADCIVQAGLFGEIVYG